MQTLLIIALAIVSAVLYGIVHDLVTTQVCIEYFTEWHPPIFGGTQSPWMLALGWGVIATWWVGLPLGCMLAGAARAGGLPKLTAGDLIRPMLIVLSVMLVLAMLAGWYACTQVRVPPDVEAGVAPQRQARFMFDAGAHLASYALGVVAAVVLCAWTIWRRVRANKVDSRELNEAWAQRGVT